MLSAMILAPTLVAALLLLAGGDEAARARTARGVALGTTLVLFACAIWLWARFDPANGGFQFVRRKRPAVRTLFRVGGGESMESA